MIATWPQDWRHCAFPSEGLRLAEAVIHDVSFPPTRTEDVWLPESFIFVTHETESAGLPSR